MDTKMLFTTALGLQAPWQVTRLEFDAQAKRLDVRIDFPRGSVFPCPECQQLCKVHDAPEHEWRHLNFFEHKAYLRARQPRTTCPEHGVRQVAVPWARPGSGFTLLLEAFVLELVRSGMAVRAVARMVGEHDTRIWRVIEHYVAAALARLDLSALRRVGVDETSRAKGHSYVTLFVDLATHKVVFIALGKDHTTVEDFHEWLAKHGGAPSDISDFSLDMSQAFIKGIGEQFPGAALTFDKFHVIGLATKAIEKVRRAEQKDQPALKDTRFLWLKNEGELTTEEKTQFEAAKAVAKKTSRAHGYKETLRALYKQADRAAGEDYLKDWIRSASRCHLEPIKSVARTLLEHRDGVLHWFDSQVTNGILEGLNSLVQAAKRAARGFRNPNYLATLIYLRLGGLDLKLPRCLPD